MINNENIFNNSPFGYALHCIMSDETGKPEDCKFLEVNDMFENLSGLNKSNIVGKSVKEAFSGTEKSKFDWTNFYEKVVMEETEENFEYFSEALGKYFKIYAYFPQKEYFVTIFTDITDRKQTERNLKAYAALIGQSQDIMVVKDLDLRVIATNDAFVKAAGRNNVEELIGKTDSEIFGVDEKTEPIKSYMADERNAQKLPPGNFILREEPVIFPDGSTKWALTKKYPIYDGKTLIGTGNISVDITEKRKVETVLQKTKDDLQIISDNMLDLVSVTDFEGNYKFVGSSHRILGYEIEYLIGKNSKEFVHPDDLPNVQAKFAEFITSKTKTSTASYRYRCADGSYLWLETIGTLISDHDGKPKEILFNTRDITKKIEYHNKLIENQKKFQKLFDESPIALLIHDKDTGEIIDANKHGLELYECESLEELQSGEFWNDPEFTKELALVKIRQTFENGFQGFEWKHRRKDGSAIWQNVTLNKIEIDNKTRILAAVLDISAQKNSEMQLRQSEEKYRLIAENVTDVIWILNLTKKKFTYISPSIYALRGYTPEEAMQQDLNQTLTPESAKIVKESISERLPRFLANPDEGLEKFYRKELRQPCKDGSIIWIETTTRYQLNKDNEVEIIGVSRNIDERKKIEEKIRENESTLESITSSAQDAIIMINNDGNITFWNPAATHIFGYEESEAMGRNLHKLIVPEKYHSDQKKAFKNFQKTGKGEAIGRTLKLVAVGKDNKEIPVSLSLSSLIIKDQWYAVGIMRDITEEKKAEEELYYLNKMQSMLMKIASDYINIPQELVNQAINNSLKELGEFVSADRAYIFDYDWEKNICHNTYEWCREGIKSEIENLQNVPNDFINNWIEPHKQGKEICIENVSDLPLEDATRKILWEQEIKSLITVPLMNMDNCIGFIGFDSVKSIHKYSDREITLLKIFSEILVNIGNRKELDRRLVESKEEALLASKAKSEFIANMSHEIRTPMNSVIGFSELLQGTELNSFQKQYVDIILASGKGLLGIINDILDFSKIEAGKLDIEIIQTDLIDLIEQTTDLIKYPASEKGLELLLNIDSEIPRFAMVDPVRLRQILANLLSNALKFTEKGEIELKALLKKIEGNRGTVQFSVRDTGIGISDDQKEKLFKAFSQADGSTTRKFGGTGLGLVISNQLTQKMGSKIEVESVPGNGSEFSFTIEIELTEGEELKSADISHIKRCLVIDDNKNNRTIMEHILTKWDIECVTCDNGFESLEIIEQGKAFDVIVCDYYMPDIDGLETVKMMREKLNLPAEKQPIILLHSFSDDSQLQKKCKELGIFFRLTKPVKQAELLNCFINIQQGTFNENEYIKIEDNTPVQVKKETKSYKILIAEDNPNNMLLVSTLIKQLVPAAEVIKAENGKEALAKMVNLQPDLIFMDVQMPEMDGNEATAKLRGYEKANNLKHNIVVGLTAGALKQEKEKSLDNGMDDFLTKPIEIDKLKAVLDKYLGSGEKQHTNLDEKKIDFSINKEKHFDREKLFSILNDNVESFKTLIAVFIDDTQDKINYLETLLESNSFEEALKTAHSMKGSTANFRCGILSDIIKKIEKEIRSEDAKAAGTILQDIKVEWEVVLAILNDEISG